MMFCPQAACKTIVPDTFRVLLSQRRRWINSTIHNLAELLLVRDLCGTFCFSMQFVVGMELVGTLVLPAAIAFTIYLLVITIIPGTTKPIVPLILLAIILGLPGVLIVVTSRRLAYVGWCVVDRRSCLTSQDADLPPLAAHMEFCPAGVRLLEHGRRASASCVLALTPQFSWGQTRKIAGEKAEKGHGDKEGEFDSSMVVMKRWSDWERERRWRLQTGSGAAMRDSSYDSIVRRQSPSVVSPQPHGSPGRAASNRYSVGSSSEIGGVGVASGSSSDHAFYRPANVVPGQAQLTSLPSVDGEVATVGAAYSSNAVHNRPNTLELPAPLAPRMGASGSRAGSGSDASPDPFYGEPETLDDASSLPSSSRPPRDYGRHVTSDESEPILNAISPPMASSPSLGQIVYTDDPVAYDPPASSVVGVGAPTSRQSRGFSLVDVGPVAPSAGSLRTVANRRTSAAGSDRPSRASILAPSPALPPGAAPARPSS